MRYIAIIVFLLFAAAASAQVVRGAGIVYTNGAPNHNPGSLGSPQGIDTITGYWYQYDYTNAAWRQAGFWLQPTGTSGTPSYTPAKQRQLFAINTGDSIFYYRSGAWRLLNGPPVAGTNIDVSGRTVTLDTLGLVRFKTDQTYANGTGSMGWNADSETVVLGLDGNVYYALGLDQLYHVINDTSVTLTKGRLVRASGASGASGKLKAKYYAANMGIHGRYVLGIVSGDIATGDEGYVTSFGLVRGINASGSLYSESWSVGDILYAHPTIAGGLTKTEPTAPNERVVVAMVISNNASTGSIFVRPQFPFNLAEIRDVKISNPTNGQALTYNSTSGLWENSSAAAGISYSDTTSLIATQHYVNSRGFLTAEVDGSTTNEIQTIDTLAIVSDSLRVSLNNNGVPYTAVNLGAYKQTLSIASDKSTLTISNGNTITIPVDTVALATFGGGSGATRDTAVFTTSAIYGSFYNDGTDTLVITSMRIGLQGTSPSVVATVIYNDTLNVTGTELVTSGTTATNTAGGTSVTSFNNTKIPPGNWVWAKTTTVTTKPTYMNITIIGYRKRKA